MRGKAMGVLVGRRRCVGGSKPTLVAMLVDNAIPILKRITALFSGSRCPRRAEWGVPQRVSLKGDVGIGTQKIQEPVGTCLSPELAQLAVDMEVVYEVFVNESVRAVSSCCVSINPLRRGFLLRDFSHCYPLSVGPLDEKKSVKLADWIWILVTALTWRK